MRSLPLPPHAARPGLHIALRSGRGRAWGGGRVPGGGGARQLFGAHTRRAPGRAGGLRRRPLQAWRGVCALRRLSLRDRSKAAEKSAAVPLPVEAAAAAEDAHWRSGRSPRRRRPRPRRAPRPPSANRARPGRAGGLSNPASLQGVITSAAGALDAEPATRQLLQMCAPGQATSACPLPEPGNPPGGEPAAPTELSSEVPGEFRLGL